MSRYRTISQIGSSQARNPSTNPITYCLLQTVNSPFMHGAIGNTISGKYSSNCQSFMSTYCANNWDNICEFSSKDNSVSYPSTETFCGYSDCGNLNAGEILIKNTASRKYLTDMQGNCQLKWQPFDPTVADSPLISKWYGTCNSQGNGGCIPIYEVDHKIIDSDPVMNKILSKPDIAMDILINIYNTAIRKGTIDKLKGTRIYNFFASNYFQNKLQILKYIGQKYN